MSGIFYDIHRSLIKGTGNAPLAAPQLPKKFLSPLPKISMPLPPEVSKLKIDVVDPAKIIAQAETSSATKINSENPVARKRITSKMLPAVAAGAAVFLVPALAFASSGLVATLSLLFNPVTMIGAGIGIYLLVRYSWNTYKSLKPENYQSAKSPLSTASPTPHKIMKTLIAPAAAAVVSVGTFMAFAPLIHPAITWIAGGAITLYSVSKFLVTSTRDIYHHIKFKNDHIQKNVHKEHLGAQIFTNLTGNGGWWANVMFMAQMSKVFATEFWGMSFNLIGNIAGITSSLPGLGTASLIGAGLFGLYHLTIGNKKARVGQPLQKQPNLVASTLKRAALGAAVAGVTYLAGPGMMATNLFVFAAALAFGHNFIHSTRSQEGGMRQKDRVFPIFDLQDLWENVRSVFGAARTVYKPGVNMIDPLTSAYVMTLISEGAHWILNAVSGAYTAKDYKEAQQMIENLLNKDAQVMRRVIKNGYRTMLRASNSAQAADAFATTLENIAKLLDNHLAAGDLLSRCLPHLITDPKENDPNVKSFLWRLIDALANTTDRQKTLKAFKDELDPDKNPAAKNNPAMTKQIKDLAGKLGLFLSLTDSTYSAGLPGSTKERSDQDLRVHGEHIRFAARILEENARRYRQMDVSKITPYSLKENLTQKLNALYTRAYPHSDTHPGRFWTNFLPDSYNAKQFVIDLCSQVMADFVGAMEVVVKNPEGKTEIWLVPMKMVKDFKTNYRKINAIESRDTLGEDLRFEWYERAEKDIGDSLCEIAYIDNSAHYKKYLNKLAKREISEVEFLSLYPTAEVTTPPQLKPARIDPVTKRVIEAAEHYDVVYKNGARLRIYADGSEVVGGSLPPNASQVIMLPGTGRHTHLKLNDVAHPWGGSMVSDTYLRPRWRFMYPTEYTSVSDADQMDRAVTNLRLFHTRSNPHLRVMMERSKIEKLPFSKDMIENEHDSFLEVGIAVVWMMLKVKLPNGKELFIPLNRNKENERTFGGNVGLKKIPDIWKYIDERQPVTINGRYLEIKYREQAKKDPSFRMAQKEIERIPLPVELAELLEAQKLWDKTDKIEIRIDPVRYGETGGPVPVDDYLFMRRDKDGNIVNRERKNPLSPRVAQILLRGNSALANAEEIEHMEMAGVKKVREFYPWADDKDAVHFFLDQAEYDSLSRWISLPSRIITNKSDVTIPVKRFVQLCNEFYQQATYRRFMPDHTYRTFFDSAETE